MAIEEKKCVFCSKKFIGTAKAVYCGNKCRQAAFREKQRVKKREVLMSKKSENSELDN